jgi:hypothetical protein
MNTHTIYLTSTTCAGEQLLPTVELFDFTKLTLDLSQVYSGVFPNYLAIEWGDGSALEEPDITIYRNYITDSIYPEVRDGASPVFFNTPYPHLFYPSGTALKKELTMRVNVGYITGDVSKFVIPINVRTEGYYENINDLELLDVNLLNNKDNKSTFTFLTKQDNYVIQNHNNDTTEYNTVGSINTLSSYYDTSHQSIIETQSLLSAVADPVGAEAKFNFIESLTDESATWATTFWGYPNRSVYDFSGTSYRATGFRNDNNITLISPRHGISVAHFTDDPKADDVAFFYDHTTCNSVSATVSDVSYVPGRDLIVTSFDRDMSTATTSTGADSSIKLYKLPYFANEVPPDKYPIVYQGGNAMFDTGVVGFQDHFAGYGSIGFINQLTLSRNVDNIIINNYNPSISLRVGPPVLPDFRLTNVSPTLSTYNLSLSGVANGDSGGPMFIAYSNELLLLGILQTGSKATGEGRNFGNSDIQEDISAGMEAVGNSWGYKLSTVRLS